MGHWHYQHPICCHLHHSAWLCSYGDCHRATDAKVSASGNECVLCRWNPDVFFFNHSLNATPPGATAVPQVLQPMYRRSLIHTVISDVFFFFYYSLEICFFQRHWVISTLSNRSGCVKARHMRWGIRWKKKCMSPLVPTHCHLVLCPSLCPHMLRIQKQRSRF